MAEQIPSHSERRSVREVCEQIDADHREGKEKVVMTRAMARAVYYALWDTLQETTPRDHEQSDLERLSRFMSTVSGIGWPLGDPDD